MVVNIDLEVSFIAIAAADSRYFLAKRYDANIRGVSTIILFFPNVFNSQKLIINSVYITI